ncbi:hypothetical protein RYX36_009670, partial [Vicia faba]
MIPLLSYAEFSVPPLQVSSLQTVVHFSDDRHRNQTRTFSSFIFVVFPLGFIEFRRISFGGEFIVGPSMERWLGLVWFGSGVRTKMDKDELDKIDGGNIWLRREMARSVAEEKVIMSDVRLGQASGR